METLRWTSAVTIVLLAQLVYAEKPCFSVGFGEAESNVCMCTSGYCDDIIREPPLFGSFVTYVSSEGGLRFEKTVGSLETFYYQHPDNSCPARDGCIPSTYLDPSTTYQTIEGFGGAVTDAAGINWRSLRSARLQQHLIESYFGDRGLEYNMIRTPIGGCDFSTHPYAYNEVPVNDAKLSNFTLSKEDYDYKLPMIKRAIKAAGKREVHIVATTWSPPPWMKSNNAFVGTSTLKEEYYQTYADYHLRFLEAFSKEGVPVWGITTTNEPSNAVIEDNFPINSMGWQVTAQGKWIANNLGPTIRDSNFQDTKIICNDDQRHHIIDYFNTLTRFVPEALPYIDGVATHFYLDPDISPEVLKTALKDHPDKFLMSTEACTGANTNEDRGVVLGSWERAQRYINSIIEYMNYNAAGWIDWNLCLDEQGGPNWSNNFVDSPIIVSDDGQKFYKQPMYYALGHVSKFVPRGSKRIHVDTLCENDSVTRTAFLTPDDNLVTVLHNSGEATDYFLVTCNRMVKLQLDEKSITTVEFPREECTNAVAF